MHFQWDTDANTSQTDSNAKASSDAAATPVTSSMKKERGAQSAFLDMVRAQSGPFSFFGDQN